MTAIFKRKLTTTTPVLGGEIKDSPVSTFYGDVFDGNTHIFSKLENLTTGQLPVGAFPNAVDYLLKFPVLFPPRFGEATLSGLELNLYFSGLDYQRDFYTSRFKIFKTKIKHEGLQYDGIFGELQETTDGGKYDDMFFASARPNRVLFETETFEQIESGDTPNLQAASAGAIFVNADYAFGKLDSFTETTFSDKEEFLSKYAEDYLGEEVVFLTGYMFYGLATVTTIYRWVVSGFDPDYDTGEYKRVAPIKTTWGFDPNWTIEQLSGHIRTTGTLVDLQLVKKSKVTADNSFFDDVRYTPAVIEGRTESGEDETKAFSYPLVEASGSGKALAMSATWSSTLKRGEGSGIQFVLGDAAQRMQTVMLMKRLPHPTEKIRLKGDSGVQKDGLEIDIKFNIETLPKMERVDELEAGLLASRGFFITLASRPPGQTENLSRYLWNIYKGRYIQQGASGSTEYVRNPKLDYATTTTKSQDNIWILGFISYSEEAPSGDITTDGNLCVITGSNAGSRKNYIHSVGDGINEPYIETGSLRSQTDPFGTQASDGNASHSFRVPSFGEWNKLKIIIAPNRSRIGYVITDTKDRIFWSRKEKAMGHHEDWGGDLPGTPVGDGFPSYMCFWLNNRRIGFSLDESTSGYYEGRTASAISKVFIDSVSISNVTCEINNASNMKFNRFNKAPVLINSESTIPPIDTQDLNNGDVISSGSNFGSLSGLFLDSIYDTFGIKHPIKDEDGNITGYQTATTGVIPSYMIFGTLSYSAWEAQDTSLYLGGFSTDNSEYSDYNDATKRMAITTTPASSDVVVFASDDTADLGCWANMINDNNINQNSSPYFRLRVPAGHTATNQSMEVRYFTRKGFVRFYGGDIRTGNKHVVRRECPFLASKITSISKASTGEITVNNTAGLLGKGNEQYIIYRSSGKAFSSSGGAYQKSGIRLKEDPVDTTILRFRENLSLADNGTSSLCIDAYLDELYISPYRFWVVMEMYNISSSGNNLLPAFTYNYALLLDNTVAPVNTTKGLTYSESLYSDAPYNQNAWSLNISKNSIIETEIDYGFGSREDEKEGYLTSQQVTKDSDFTLFDISGLVEVEGKRLETHGELINLFITKDIKSKGSAKLATTSISSALQKPFLTFVYKDELPIIEDFKVQPNEDDPFYPHYTWDSDDDDLWYGFVILDGATIENQYHSAVAHIPMNERGIATDGSKTYLYKYNGSFKGAAVAGDGGAGLTNTIEGLAGYALDFDGSTQRYVYWNDNSYTDPTSSASFVAHVVVDSTTANHYIVSKREQFEIYIDSGGKINTKLYYSSTASVNLQSFSVVPDI